MKLDSANQQMFFSLAPDADAGQMKWLQALLP